MFSQSRARSACFAMALALIATQQAPGQPDGPAADRKPVDQLRINVRDFADRVEDGDWSAAIQAAIDHVHQDNGYKRGAVVYFPAGRYRVNQTIVLGKKEGQWGTQLLGYGARLVGSEALDSQDRKKRLAERQEALSGDKRTALADDKGLGPAILELHNPPGAHGAGFVIEGLTFTRSQKREGVGIKIPAGEVPKATTFRNVRVLRQDVGVHVNYAWQIYFSDCLIRDNRIGLHGQNHFNAISIVNTTFRRNHNHGLKIGPNQGQWGSSGIHIAGCIFEANKGYGIHNAGGIQTAVNGCYFEANGNSVYITTSFGNTTIDTCHFWNFYPAEWGYAAYEGQGHVVIDGTKNVQLRNNRYGKGTPILVAGPLRGEKNRFDGEPSVAEGTTLPDSLRVVADGGLSYYDYNPEANAFERKSLVDEPEDVE